MRSFAEPTPVTCYRVETLQRYDNGCKRDGLRRYLAGEPEPPGAGRAPWTRQLRAHATTVTRSWRVLHAVAEPLSDYLRYEAEWGYARNAGGPVRTFGSRL